jgi:hypothetical protein
MQEQSIMAIILALPLAAMVVWFFKTVAQGSISFTLKPLGLHFEVRKES